MICSKLCDLCYPQYLYKICTYQTTKQISLSFQCVYSKQIWNLNIQLNPDVSNQPIKSKLLLIIGKFEISGVK